MNDTRFEGTVFVKLKHQVYNTRRYFLWHQSNSVARDSQVQLLCTNQYLEDRHKDSLAASSHRYKELIYKLLDVTMYNHLHSQAQLILRVTWELSRNTILRNASYSVLLLQEDWRAHLARIMEIYVYERTSLTGGEMWIARWDTKINGAWYTIVIIPRTDLPGLRLFYVSSCPLR